MSRRGPKNKVSNSPLTMAPARSRSLAIVACCALSGSALGQSLPPFRVDPSLLGNGAPAPAVPTPVPAPPLPAAVAVPVPTPPPITSLPAAPVVSPSADSLPPSPASPAPAPATAARSGNAKAVTGPRKSRTSEPAAASGSGLRPAPPAAPPLGAPLPVIPAREERPREARAGAPRLEPEGKAAEPQREASPAAVAATVPPQILKPEEWTEAERESLPPPALRASSALLERPARSDDPRPSFISADRLSGVNDREAVAEGAVELRRIGTVINAGRLVYRHVDDEVEAEGDVRLARDQSVITGPRLRLRIEDQVGSFEQPEYSLRRSPAQQQVGRQPNRREATEAHGRASKIEFQGENQFELSDASYSTCKPGDDSWFAKVAGLHLDYDREVAEGRDAAVYFKGIPIIYSPWISFSLNNQRKSGFLPPTFGSTSQSGSEFTLPYYWNIAPNMDATIAPRFFTKRGIQVNNELRYLSETYNGQARVELLPNDRVRHRDRWGYSIQHAQNLGFGVSGSLNLNGVSDDFYYNDLSSRISNSAQTLLLRQGALSYGGSWWNVSALATRYQTLQPDPANPVQRPYEITPQLTLNARKTLFDLADVALLGQFTSYTHPELRFLEARRTVLYPQVSVPFVTPAFYVTPKVGVHMTRYGFERHGPAVPDTLSRAVPISSIDSGVTFERTASLFGREFTQTLEPRLYYLYVPNRDQNVLTANGINFDSGISDFNFAQIFSENLFSGHDRIADANQLTTAVSTRLLDPSTGGEYLKAMVGQRLYFSGQSVTLNLADARRTSKKTDLLAAATGQIAPKTYGDVGWQYNPRDGRTERLNIGARYQPDSRQVINAAYRFGRNQTAPFDVSIKQIDVSGQWPLFGGWQAVGRYNYSISEKRVIETIGGLEYNSGCWAARVVVQRFSTSATTSTSAVFFQLELSDFSRVGSNPLELLKRSIPGYGHVDQPAADPVFGSAN